MKDNKTNEAVKILADILEKQLILNKKLQTRIEVLEKQGKVLENKNTNTKRESDRISIMQRNLLRLLSDKNSQKLSTEKLEELAELHKQYEDKYYPEPKEQPTQLNS